MCSSPFSTLTVSVFHRLKLLTGAADQLRHDEQWQYPAAAASPSTLISTAPQKQLPLYDLAIVPLLEMWVGPCARVVPEPDSGFERAVRRVTRRRVHSARAKTAPSCLRVARLCPIVLGTKRRRGAVDRASAFAGRASGQAPSNGRHLL